jgi:hypothetical protein
LCADAALHLSDGDHRTYAFIVTLAVQSQRTFVDLSYEELARRHPGSGPLSPAAVRARIARLVEAGLLRRERAGRTCWRTVVTTFVGATADGTHPVEGAVGAIPDDIHRQSDGSGLQLEITPTAVVASVGATADRTQESPNPAAALLGTMHYHSQVPVAGLPDTVDRTHVHMAATPDSTHANDVTVEPPDSGMNVNPSRSQSDLAHRTPTERTAETAALAQALRSLKPKPMNSAGVAECLRAPELTAAWLAWVTDPANGVESPAAYLRSQIRRGHFPPDPAGGRSTHAQRERQQYAAGRTAASSGAYSAAAAGVAVAAGAATRWPLDAGAL